MHPEKCRNCDRTWNEHQSDRHGPFCIRVYRPEIVPEEIIDRGLLRVPWFASLTQRQTVLLTRIVETALMAIIVGALLSILKLR